MPIWWVCGCAIWIHRVKMEGWSHSAARRLMFSERQKDKSSPSRVRPASYSKWRPRHFRNLCKRRVNFWCGPKASPAAYLNWGRVCVCMHAVSIYYTTQVVYRPIRRSTARLPSLPPARELCHAYSENSVPVALRCAIKAPFISYIHTTHKIL